MRPTTLPVSILLLIAHPARADGPTDPPDKGGTRPEALSLPSGPGSLQGMGESVNAEPATGALTLVVPVTLPPGPRHFEPDLSLHYGSRTGNGPIGLGWSLALPEISRRTTRGLPRYAEGQGPPSDELLWMGKRLIQVGSDVWRLRVEGEFTRIVSLGGAADGFRADRRDGSKVFLGTSAASQLSAGGRIFRWLPERALDPFGNEIVYRYSRDQGQLYLSEVRYGAVGSPQARAVFTYENRADVQLDLRAGFPIATAQRLVSIATFVGGDPGEPVRRVALRYASAPGISRLSSAQSCGSDGTTCLPALSFTFTGADPAQAVVQTLVAPAVSLGDADSALLDVDGDSLPDIVRLTALGATVWRNLGPEGFAAAMPLVGAPGVDLSSPGVAFQDMDGDGRADLLMALGTFGEDGYVYLPASGAGLGASVAVTSPLNLPPSSAQLRWIDLDGDGRVDALSGQTDGWTLYLNQGDGNFGAPTAIDSPLPGLALDDHRVRLADMNDDGLVDIVLLQSGILQVLTNQGFGSFSAPQPMSGVPDVQGDDQRLALGDADGDGLPDLYYVASGRLSLWLNRGDGSFGEEMRLPNAPSYDPLSTTVRLVDLLGNGTRGVLYSGSQDGRPFLWFFDPTSGQRPGLIAGVDNGMGGVRGVTYRSTGQMMAEAAAAGLSWSTFAPFPQSLVVGIALDDGVSVVETEVRSYSNPRYDGSEHLFAGFAEERRELPADGHAAGLVEETVFHTGAAEDLCLVGRAASQSQSTASGVLMRKTTHQVVAQPVVAGLLGEVAAFAAQVVTTRELWEGQTTPLREQARFGFDGHGNLIDRYDDGRIGGPLDPSGDHLRYAYAEDENLWILGLVSEKEVERATGGRIALERRTYDQRPLGVVTRGAQTGAESWIADDQFVVTRTNVVDEHGNITAWVDADGRRVEVDYDSVLHQYPIEERHFPDASGRSLRFDVAVDPATGQPLWFREADGALTRYGWDPLGRLISIERPSDPSGDPGELRRYELGPQLRSLQRLRRATSGTSYALQEADLYDGLLRPLAHVTSAEEGAFAVSERVQRDVQGHAAVRFVPFFASALTAVDPAPTTARSEESYDTLSRTVRRALPAGGETRWAFGPGNVTVFDAEAAGGRASPERRWLDWKDRVATVDTDLGGLQPASYAFERDPLDHVLSRRGPLGVMATATYDGLGRLVDLIDADSGHTRWAYDGMGHPLSRSNAAGQTLRWTYDGAGRVLTEDDDEGPRATYRYDLAAEVFGRLGEVEDRSGITRYAYDGAGRLAGFVVSQAGITLSLGFDYDEADRLQRVHFPDGQVMEYRYGSRGLVTSIPGLLDGASYDAAGQPLARAFANGVRVQVGRDAAERVVEVGATDGTGSLLSVVYELRQSGALLSSTDEAGKTEFELDDQERLIAELSPQGPRRQAFDSAGRLLSRTAEPPDTRLPGETTTFGESGGPDALSHDEGGEYRYDAMGQRTRSRQLALTYDAAGQLLAASSEGLSASYRYAFDGQRRSRRAHLPDGRETSVLQFGPWVEIDDGVLWEHVVAGAERIASLSGDLSKAQALGARAIGSSGCSSALGDPTLGVLVLLVGLGRRRARPDRRARGPQRAGRQLLAQSLPKSCTPPSTSLGWLSGRLPSD
jgi:YD repeat-containing protein